MEDCRGGELFGRVYSKGKYTEKAAANVIKQLLSAMCYILDNNGVRCDLKPHCKIQKLSCVLKTL